jgi:hypothetical protein
MDLNYRMKLLFHRPRRLSLLTLLSLGAALGFVRTASAIVLYDTDFAQANTSAPTGNYANSGWAYQGEYGSFLGTMIGSQYFITAQHFGTQGSTFTSRAAMNGSVDVTYTIDTSANGGQGYWDIAGTDLRILRINESFSSYAQLYAGNAEAGKTMVTFGRGGPRGAAVDLNGPVQGWYHTGSDGVTRWGANTVDAVVPSGIGGLLVADFDAVSGQNEATLSSGDSGGGVFIQVSGQWYLAGLNYGVDGYFDTNTTQGDGSEFNAALFDKNGYYMGNDGTGWQLQSHNASRLYASRVSDSYSEIQAIITSPVPESGSAALFLIGGLACLRRSRSSAKPSHL